MGGMGGVGQRGADEGFMGISLKRLSLVANSGLILILYYSRTMPTPGVQRYFTSTAVFLNEVLKFGISLSIAMYELSRNMSPNLTATSLIGSLSAAVFTGDSWKLAIPASLYTLQNSLQYVAISNLDAATLQVTYQFKIIPTALFSIIILRRRLSPRKWIALGLLIIGLAIVQFPHATSRHLAPLKHPSGLRLPRAIRDTMKNALYKRSATYEGIEEDLLLGQSGSNPAMGLAAALCSCIVSSLASVYFEKILKDSHAPVSVWVRNVQLSFYSIFPALFIGVVFLDGEVIARSGFFVGYNWVVWTTVTCQAIGGILVALCIHYADNIVKSFAMSISLLLGLCGSIYFFHVSLTTNFLVGTCVVLYATYHYNSSTDRNPRPPPIQIHAYEKTTIGNLDEPFAPSKSLTTPYKAEALSSSRPSTPSVHARDGSARGYFSSKHRDE